MDERIPIIIPMKKGNVFSDLPPRKPMQRAVGNGKSQSEPKSLPEAFRLIASELEKAGDQLKRRLSDNQGAITQILDGIKKLNLK